MATELTDESEGILPEGAAIGLQSIQNKCSEDSESCAHSLRYRAERIEQRVLHGPKAYALTCLRAASSSGALRAPHTPRGVPAP
jgi:hypothetical protein